MGPCQSPSNSRSDTPGQREEASQGEGGRTNAKGSSENRAFERGGGGPLGKNIRFKGMGVGFSTIRPDGKTCLSDESGRPFLVTISPDLRMRMAGGLVDRS